MVLFLVVVHAKSEYLVVKSSSRYQDVLFDHFRAFCFGVSMLQSPGLQCPWERGLLGMLC